MAESTPYTKTHFPFSELNSRIQPKPINKGKFCSSFLFKYLFLALFIIVVPLFPSQAPDFVNQTLLTKFWELIHLLFIGIAVAYGLFSRRNVEPEIDIESESSFGGATSFVSKMFPVSTIFDDGCENENPCGYDEKRMMHCWNPQYFDGEKGGFVCPPNGGTVGVFDEQYKTQLPISEDNFDYLVRSDGNGTNVVQAWNSENFHSEPVVVVAQPCYTNGEFGEVVGYKPLGLPVRSLRSVAGGVDSPKYINESDSSSGSRGSCKSSLKSRDREFGDLDPSNLEKRFNDASAVGGSVSPIPWRSRSRRMGREKGYGNVTRPMHFRPLSVDETKFEALSSRSLQSTMPFSSHATMYSSLNSISSDNMNFQEQEIGNEEAPPSEKMNFQEEGLGQKKTSFVSVSENMFFKEEDMGQRKTSYVPGSENMNFQEVDLGKKIFQGSSSRNGRMATKGKYAAVSYPSHFRPMSVDETQFESLTSEWQIGNEEAPPSEKMDFQEEGLGQKKTSFVSVSENMFFKEEDMGQRKTSYVPGSENMNFQEVDLGKKIFQGSSSRNGRMATKGKYPAVSYPSHFRPMSVDETQFESLTSRSFQSMGSFSSHKSMYSSLDSSTSDDMNFQEEDIGQKNTSHVHASENMNFQEEYVHASENMNFQEKDMGQKKTFYVHASENMNSQEEDMGQRKTFYVHASENMNFQEEEDMGQKKTFYVHASENVNFQEENLGQRKTFHVPASENMDFQEVDLRKKISQRPSSRNGRMETKGKSAAVSHPSHFRPMSVDETQFESLSSRSFQSMGSFSSRTSLCSSLDSASSENMNLLKEDFGEKKSSYGSSSSSPSPPDRRNHAGGYSNGSLLQDGIKSNLNEDLGAINGTRDEDPIGNKELGMHALLSDSEKPANLSKTPTRGKSVRTRRANGLASGQIRIGEISSKQIDEKVEKKSNNVEAVLMRKDKMRSGEPDLLLKGISKKTLDSYCPKPEVTFTYHHKRDKLEPSKNVSKEDSDIELENIQVSSDEDVVYEHVNDSGLDSEVDKKASEFIAKFKAQIRLQKMGSIERSKGQKTIGNYIR